MNERKLVPYLKELGRNLRVNPFRRRRILLEVRDHLLRTVEQERAAGADPDWAQEAAIAEFGDPASAAHRFTPASPDSTPYYYGASYRPGIPNPTAAVTRRRQSKTVTLAFGGIALVLFLIIAALALVFIPPSPPTISEFQPQAEQQIEEAPLQQSSRFGSGEGGLCAAGQECEAESQPATPTKRVIEKARVRRCLGDPPRQTEDPQSPPCVNFWEGDNGGATSKGVSRNEIRIAVHEYYPSTNIEQQWKALARHVNLRYELYGRQIRLFDLGVVHSDIALQRAAAEKAATELNAFATLGGPGSAFRDYRRELARYGVLSVYGSQLLGPVRSLQDAISLFAWDYYATLEDTEENLAEFICKSLAGRTAQYAGPAIQQQTRKFAAVYLMTNFTREVPPISPLQQGMETCDLPLFVTTARQANPTSVLAAIGDLQSRQVTTVVLLDSDINASNNWLSQSSKVGYIPEWLLVGADQDLETQWLVAPPEQRAHIFGVVPWNKTQRNPDEPAFWAYKEGDPNISSLGYNAYRDYHAVLVLASGIQMAGPKLSPQSFARALEGTSFANPGAGDRPYYQAGVGFKRSHSMTNDYALVWWSNAAPTYRPVATQQTETGGGFCFLHRGARWSRGRWPSGDPPLFDVDLRNCR